MSESGGSGSEGPPRRREAAMRLVQQGLSGQSPPSAEEALGLLHELQVHQIELGLQNEELIAARAALEISSARYTDLYDFAPIGYFTLGREGVIVDLNLTAAAMLGRERDHLLGRRLGTFVADKEALAAALAQVFAAGTASCELELAAPEGDHRRSSVVAPHYALLTAQASPGAERCRVVLADLTERKRAEQRLRDAHKMEAIGHLAGGIAHDFNNLLTVILSHADFALGAAVEGSELHEDLVALRGASQRAAALTQQLLAFSRTETLRRQIVDVNQVLRELAAMLRRVLGEHIDVVLDPGTGVLPIEVDPVQFEQVIMNLAVNARDAMPDGGRMTISTSSVERAATLKGSGATDGAPSARFTRVTVSDTGCGMDQATLSQIFEPFFTTKDQGRGTGFGLSTVYGIVRRSGGEIAVRSVPGSGSTFEVDLPQATGPGKAMAPARSAAEEPAMEGTETILLVEDEDAVRRIVKRMLASAGYDVLEVRSAEEALRLCAEHPAPIHLLLTDVVMPSMTGFALAERVGALRPAMRVLVMSGYPDGALGAREVQKAPEHFLGKPFTVDQLRRKVREVLDERRPAAG